jgi:photosystem II stability/assembly factor-like uncharacterized protein
MQIYFMNYKITIIAAFFTFILYSFSIGQVISLSKFPQTGILNIKDSLKTVHWRNIGPNVMSGRVVDVSVNPNNTIEFFVGYATGGVWYTNNNGQSFTPVFEKPTTCIGAIAVNWQAKEIWVGTGEVNSSRSSYAGKGMFKGSWTSDTSFNFVPIGLYDSHHIGNITLHPTNKNIAYVAVLGHLYTPNIERGLYKTIDGGKTWIKTLYINDNTGVVDIAINLDNPQILFAAAWYRTRKAWDFVASGKTSGIYKSIDGGNTWKLVPATSGFPTGEGIGRIGLGIAQGNTKIIYAVVDNQNKQALVKDTSTKKEIKLMQLKNISKPDFLALDDNLLDTLLKKQGVLKKYNAAFLKQRVRANKLAPTALFNYMFDANTALFETPIIGCEVYKSEDEGNTWVKTNTKPLKLYNTYGYYFGKIYVSPINTNKVVITGFNIELSIDGGKTFKKMDKGNVHPDHHACWINPVNDNHMIIGNDGGLNITYDNGKAWFLANTPAVGQLYSINVDDATPYNVYCGLQDNGVWWGSSQTVLNYDWYAEGHNPYTQIYGGDGMQTQIDTRDNKTVYAGLQFGNYNRLDKTLPTDYSVNYLTPQHNIGEPAYRFNWQTPILLSPHNKDIFYMGSNKLHKSFNKGDSLPAITKDLTNGVKAGNVPYSTITTISESVLQPNLIYIGTDDGNVHMSRDGGYTTTDIKKGLPQGLWVSRIIASRHNISTVYVTLNGYRNDDFTPYVFVSNDYGTTWKNISGNLPKEPINVIREDNQYAGIIYIGTDGGAYMSMDSGTTYTSISNQLPNVPVHDMIIQQRNNDLLLGTHGRSIYITNLNGLYKKIGLDEE